MDTVPADESGEWRRNRNKDADSSRYRKHENQSDLNRAGRRSRKSIEDLDRRRTSQRNSDWQEERRSSTQSRRKPGEYMDGRYRSEDRSKSPLRQERRATAGEFDRRGWKRSERREDHKTGLLKSPSTNWRSGQAPLPSQQDAFQMNETDSGGLASIEKQKPNYETSGKLAAETNKVTGTDILLKYNEPSEARKDSKPWRLYVFKDQETLEQLELYRRSCWLFGRERMVVDYELTHPSCSKQHAVIQFRHLEKRNEYGDRISSIKPYIIDLESANGTKVNGEQIPDRRFVELRSGDVLTFGMSSRDYVMVLPP